MTKLSYRFQMAGVIVLAMSAAGKASAQTAPDYAHERAARASSLTTQYGWFSLIALDWIKPGISTVGSAKDNSIVLPSAPAHLFSVEEKDGNVKLLASDASLTLHGQHSEVAEPGTLVSEDEEDAAALTSGTLRMWAIKRGDRRYLRVKDSAAPALKSFHGLSWFTPDPRLRVVAKWIPYTSPHTLQVTNKLGQVTPVPVPGYVEFELGGKKQTLIPMESDKTGFFFVFRDLTARTTTDGGGRFLSTDGPSAGLDKPGTVVLDFNEAVNPPCAYSPYATCPLASPENRLVVAVAAGEKRYED